MQEQKLKNIKMTDNQQRTFRFKKLQWYNCYPLIHHAKGIL